MYIYIHTTTITYFDYLLVQSLQCATCLIFSSLWGGEDHQVSTKQVHWCLRRKVDACSHWAWNSCGCHWCSEHWRAWDPDDTQDLPFCWSGQHEYPFLLFDSTTALYNAVLCPAWMCRVVAIKVVGLQCIHVRQMREQESLDQGKPWVMLANSWHQICRREQESPYQGNPLKVITRKALSDVSNQTCRSKNKSPYQGNPLKKITGKALSDVNNFLTLNM